MGSLMDSITSASARADVFKQVVMSSISDRANVSLLEQRLNPRDLEAVIKQMGSLYYFDAQHPSGHYLLDLSEQTHFDLAGQLMVINAGASALRWHVTCVCRRPIAASAGLRNSRKTSNGYPDLSQSSNFMCPAPALALCCASRRTGRYFRNCRLDGNLFIMTGFWRLPKKGSSRGRRNDDRATQLQILELFECSKHCF